MDIEKFTERARGFIQSAQGLALRSNNQQLLPQHLLKVLIDDEEQRVIPLHRKIRSHAPHLSRPRAGSQAAARTL